VVEEMSNNKIYPQSINGKFRQIKDYSGYVLLLIYFLGSWIRWDRGPNSPSQAVFIDLPDRRAYLFGAEIWPEEVYYIAGLLIMAALGLFFVTSLFGRIWCGYTCPHTVFVDLFVKVENYFQGDRNARMRLDTSDDDPNKFKKKVYTHICWLLISFSFAFGWVCYFYDAPKLLKDIITLEVSSGGMGWLTGLTASTYFFAGYVRQQVCIHMCPYGRFQSAMLDNDTSVVTYHDYRGEPRGKQVEDGKLGDCIDCGKCVVVCPMGIDIRKGLQLPCIGCGLCIDACDSVMQKLDRPLGLIAYDSVNSSLAKKEGSIISKNVFQLKTVLFLAIFSIVSCFMIYELATKEEIVAAIMLNRNALYTMLPDGSYRNTYTLKLYNKTSVNKTMKLEVSGPLDLSIKESSNNFYSVGDLDIVLEPQEEKTLTLYIKSPHKSDDKIDIYFKITDINSKKDIVKQSKFLTKG